MALYNTQHSFFERVMDLYNTQLWKIFRIFSWLKILMDFKPIDFSIDFLRSYEFNGQGGPK